MDRLDKVNAASKLVKKLFTYVSDDINYGRSEHWKSHWRAALAGIKFKDDCDGFALTVGDVLHKKYGVPKKLIYIIVVNTRSGKKKGNHLVCGVNVSGTIWILDNRKPYPYKQGWANYSYIKLRRMSSKKWYKYKGGV